MNDPDTLSAACEKLGVSFDQLGVIVVDHGSRREASNAALLDVVRQFEASTDYMLVEPAHMELAEPSIEQAFDRLVERGAKFVVVHPYFLLPGRHWAEDIPALALAASKKHPNIQHVVTAPLGIHGLMATIMHDRIRHCVDHVAGLAESCDLCDEQGRCRMSQTTTEEQNAS